ncbi:MAG: histidine kinase [Gemmatimonadales bacterium]
MLLSPIDDTAPGRGTANRRGDAAVRPSDARPRGTIARLASDAPRGWPILAAIWLPLSLALAVAIAQLSARSPESGALSGLVTGLLSFGLALAVWRMTALLPWQGPVRARFVVLHLLAAVGYGLLWWSTTMVVTALVFGDDPIVELRSWWASDVVGWDLMVGIAVYGLAVGISYAIRLRWSLDRERLSRAEADASARAARLEALEARLNPHFLFNTLHSVAALVRSDPAAAEDAIDSLGELLRETLAEREDGAWPLADEWRFTAKFLELERLRLGERLKVEATLDPRTLSVSVPRFLIQSLVENALRHGIGPRARGGTVRIEARGDGAGVRLTVADDGIGAVSSSPADGVGLAALRGRLLARRPQGTLQIETAPGAGFAATVSLPGAG